MDARRFLGVEAGMTLDTLEPFSATACGQERRECLRARERPPIGARGLAQPLERRAVPGAQLGFDDVAVRAHVTAISRFSTIRA